MKKIQLTFCLLLIVALSNAQNIQTASFDNIDTTLNKTQNIFLNTQAEAFLSQVNNVISKYPPDYPEPEARKSALLLLDAVLHDLYAPKRPPVQNFLKTRIKKAIDEIENTKIISGALIWKLYNHGFVIKTKSVTLGFDLVSAIDVNTKGFSISDEDMRRLVSQCDVLFVSHFHDDHAEESVAQLFIDQGKPVVAPKDVWKDKSIYTHITHLDRATDTEQTLLIQNKKQNLKVVVYPGHQGLDIENNVYLVITPEGLSFSQMGDQSNGDDFKWIDKVGNNHVVDVLMPNCWTGEIVRVAKGFNPRLIITGHENEMGHTIDHREPYWLTYKRKNGLIRTDGSVDIGYDTPLIIMTWGESYLYKRENFSKAPSSH